MTHACIWPIRICDISHSYMCHASFICATWLIQTGRCTSVCHQGTWVWMRYGIHSCVWVWIIWHTSVHHRCTYIIESYTKMWHDSCIVVHKCASPRICDYIEYTCDTTHSCICMTHICDMTHSRMCHALLIYVTWLIHICDMTHSYMWHDSLIYVTRLIHICAMTHAYMCHALFIYVTWLFHSG